MSPKRSGPNSETASGTTEQPSVEEVVKRLDKLWSGDQETKVPEFSDPTGSRLGKYEILQSIGHGAFGVVYQARDLQLGRDVALKLPRPEVLVDAERLSRFQAEATMSALLDHPSIVPIYDADLNGAKPFIASAFCPGPDLRQWLEARAAPVPPEQAARFVAELAGAVQHAHAQGVLHRDLKPSNVLLEPNGEAASGDPLNDYLPRLTDFGLAKLLEVGLHDTRSSLLIGSPLYMAPEQLSHEPQRISSATDVYALGVILFELLALKPPFDGANYVEVLDKLRTEEPIRIRDMNPAVTTDLQIVITKCLEKDPTDRYESAGELQDDLGRYLQGEALQAKPRTWLDRLARWRSQPQRVVAAGQFTIWFQLGLVVWMLIVNTTALILPVFPGELYAKSLIGFCITTFLFHIPKAWLGYRLSVGASWAFWPAAISSAVGLGIFVFGVIGPTNPFEFSYPTLLSKVNTFTALIGGGFWETTLYVLALPAWFQNRVENGA